MRRLSIISDFYCADSKFYSLVFLDLCAKQIVAIRCKFPSAHCKMNSFQVSLDLCGGVARCQ